MDENQFWIAVWRAVCAAVAAVAAVIGGCTAHDRYVVRDMVQHGANPIDASCSFGANDASICAVRAMKE